MKNKKLLFAIFINFFLLIFELFSCISEFYLIKFNCFIYYTEISNYFALIVSLIFVVCGITALIRKQNNIPRLISFLRYMSTTMLTITLIVVIFILIPLDNFKTVIEMLFEGNMLFHHLLCPLLSMISFVFFEKNNFNFKYTYYVLISTLTYGIIFIILNIVRVVEGPYKFLCVYDQTIIVSIIWFIVIIGGAYLIGALLYHLNKRFHK